MQSRQEVHRKRQRFSAPVSRSSVRQLQYDIAQGQMVVRGLLVIGDGQLTLRFH
jgi:hypothetical protein